MEQSINPFVMSKLIKITQKLEKDMKKIQPSIDILVEYINQIKNLGYTKEEILAAIKDNEIRFLVADVWLHKVDQELSIETSKLGDA